MLIYKILRSSEWEELQVNGAILGAPVDLSDGFVHFSTASQVAETAARHFAQQDGLWLLAYDADGFGNALKWEASRGGALFPHLYAPLRYSDAVWACPLPLCASGHVLPDGLK